MRTLITAALIGVASATEFPKGFAFNETQIQMNENVSQDQILLGDAISNARTWVDVPVPYSQSSYYNGYRQDCSGYVSMAWGLGSSYVTWTLPQVAYQISKGDLQAGDILLNVDEHVLIFDSWADSAQSYYNAYEQTPPNTIYHSVQYPYWSGYGEYLPYRKA
jgi:hypothetical protein